MSSSLIIAGGGLVVLTAGAIALRRQRDRATRRALAARHGWTMPPRTREAWAHRLVQAGPMRIGHSRRLGTPFRTQQGVWLFSFQCDTGFEHRRARHRWRMAACEAEHPLARATITREDWLLAMMSTPVRHALPIGTDGSPPMALVEDPEAWARILEDGLAAWFEAQPAARSWEFLPGLIVGYEPGPFLGEELEDLAGSARWLADRCAESVQSGHVFSPERAAERTPGRSPGCAAPRGTDP